MSTRLKRNAVVVTMAVLVCAAAALNWKYAGQEAVEDAQNAGTKILGEAALVSGTEDGEDTPAASPEDESGVYTGSDYFASARLTRQQARDSAISLLQEAAAQENADAAVANEASESIQVLASFTLKEAQIENLVTAKGYADCVAFMGEDSISVVVSTASGELTGEDVAKITDIAMAETGYGAGGIKIMAAN
ncbi:SpoIIIAH-like family protein [uncultured Oscillibacter sp.]|uniref:SpoIIIAH-like family protein n=1 Tax=uncultured Oscillibacter sp. TaxID=876091 RepID=UPI0025EA3AC0|nr:SpoIIIAH-like family protein [uncultured Oscillibacter sp.]